MKQELCVRMKTIEYLKQKQELEIIHKQQKDELKMELEEMHQKEFEPIMQKIKDLKRLQKNSSKSKKSDEMCVICLERPTIIALRPCGHVCLCQKCFRKTQPQHCPLCRCEITGSLKVYFP